MIPRDPSGNRDYLNPGTSMRQVPRVLTIKFVDVEGDVIARATSSSPARWTRMSHPTASINC